MTESKRLPRTQWHPHFAALFDHAAAKPGAELTHPWGHSVFRVAGKTFVFLGDPDDPGMTVKPFPGSRDVLLSSSKATIAHYIGRYGWVDFRVRDANDLKLAIDLIDESYDHNVPKRARAAALAAAALTPKASGVRRKSRKKAATRTRGARGTRAKRDPKASR